MTFGVDFSSVHSQAFETACKKWHIPRYLVLESDFIAISALQALEAMNCNVSKEHKDTALTLAQATIQVHLRSEPISLGNRNPVAMAQGVLSDYMQFITEGLEVQLNTVESTIAPEQKNIKGSTSGTIDGAGDAFNPQYNPRLAALIEQEHTIPEETRTSKKIGSGLPFKAKGRMLE